MIRDKVDPDTHEPIKVAEYRLVHIGQAMGDKRVIKATEKSKEDKEGLSKTDWVIVKGMQRVRPGAEVRPTVQEAEKETTRQPDKETRRQGDKETGRQGDKEKPGTSPGGG